MTVKSLKLNNFRNIKKIELALSDKINIVVGSNGAGKTSILESLYLLSTGRSFRTSNISKLKTINKDRLSITAEFSLNNSNLVSILDYFRDTKTKKYLLNNEPIKAISAITEMLPVCNIAGDRYKAINADPEYRRKIFDWGVFHVKHQFYNIWKNYKNILEQRNSLIRNNRINNNLYQSWDNLFAEAAADLIIIRNDYLQLVIKEFIRHISLLGIELDFDILLNHGVKSLNNINNLEKTKNNIIDIIRIELKNNLSKDLDRGYTTIGPHRADLIFKLNDDRAKYYISRGQEKMVIIAFYLAQVSVFNKYNNKRLILQLDDIAAELDNKYLNKLYHCLYDYSKNNQILITALDLESIPDYIKKDSKVFHVEQLRDS